MVQTVPAWQLQTGGMAQAGNRAGKTQCYLQWRDSGAECAAVTSARHKVCNRVLIVTCRARQRGRTPFTAVSPARMRVQPRALRASLQLLCVPV